MEDAIRSVALAIWVLVLIVFMSTCATCHIEEHISDIKSEIRNMGAVIELELKNIRETGSIDYDSMRGVKRDLNRVADELGRIKYEYTK